MSSPEPRVSAEPADLTLIGYWLGPSALGWPDVRDCVDPSWDKRERQTVIAHLRKGTRFRAFLGLSMCRFCSVANGASEQTDGTYYWPEGLAHYLEKHGVRLPQRFVGHVLRGRGVRPQVRRRDCGADTALSETWWKGQTWQNGTDSSSKNDQPMTFLEILRQSYAIARYVGYAVDIDTGVAERVGRSGELLWQAVKEAQREHEARYGPPAPPIPHADPKTAIRIDMTTGRRERSRRASRSATNRKSTSPR